MTIDRVILSVNDNPDYMEFWPIVAKAWSKIGVKPTLALIGNENVTVDESLGDVVRFKPIPIIPTSFQARTIRILLPSLFENDVCITADIDDIPLSKSYYFDPIKELSNDKFVSYNDKYHEGHPELTGDMCFQAGKGSIFKEIFFGPHNKNKKITHKDIEDMIKCWFLSTIKDFPYQNFHDLSLLFYYADERALGQFVNRWESPPKNRRVMLGGKFERRLSGNYDINLLKNDYYSHVGPTKPLRNPENMKYVCKLLKDRGWEDIIPKDSF